MLRGRMQYAIQVAVVHSTMMFGASWAYGSGGGGGTGRVSGGISSTGSGFWNSENSAILWILIAAALLIPFVIAVCMCYCKYKFKCLPRKKQNANPDTSDGNNWLMLSSQTQTSGTDNQAYENDLDGNPIIPSISCCLDQRHRNGTRSSCISVLQSSHVGMAAPPPPYEEALNMARPTHVTLRSPASVANTSHNIQVENNNHGRQLWSWHPVTNTTMVNSATSTTINVGTDNVSQNSDSTVPPENNHSPPSYSQALEMITPGQFRTVVDIRY